MRQSPSGSFLKRITVAFNPGTVLAANGGHSTQTITESGLANVADSVIANVDCASGVPPELGVIQPYATVTSANEVLVGIVNVTAAQITLAETFVVCAIVVPQK
jgi:hypothetical protein